MIRRVTMRDIAEKVQMSRATVSAVLGNKTHCYASEKTKAFIRETAMQMGYSPNPLACGLKGGRTHTIGLIESSLQNEVRRQEVVDFTNLLDERHYISRGILLYTQAVDFQYASRRIQVHCLLR